MPPVDQAKAEQFARRMLGVLNDSFLAMMTKVPMFVVSHLQRRRGIPHRTEVEQ